MACPLCGEHGKCGHVSSHGARDADHGERSTTSVLIDPDSYDFSEQQFEASLAPLARASGQEEKERHEPEPKPAAAVAPARGAETAGPGQEEANPVDEMACWREEVTSRVESYRARRKRPPRQRSLSLDFERAVNREAVASTQSPTATESAAASCETPAAGDQLPVAMGEWSLSGEADEQRPTPDPSAVEWSDEAFLPAEDRPPITGDAVLAGDRRLAIDDSNIIEFPRSPLPPIMPPSMEELAEPVLSKPRILEVPEEVETARAPLGGISLEPEEEDVAELEFELPLRVASMSQRTFSGLIDALVVLLATVVFLAIVARAGVPIPQGKALLMLLAAPALFWAVYQYLFLVHAGATPGMRMAHLALVTFEGNAVCRRVRRGRALATVLSCLSLGLGLVWALLDEDTLCWHDRISRTYVVESSSQ